MSNISTKPYFVRALYEWCLDSGYTPYITVFVDEHTRVPMQFVQDNHITLNIGMNATKDVVIDNEWISFHARFGGVAQEVFVPTGNVVGIFARETGEGMGFAVEASQAKDEVPVSTTQNSEATPKKKVLKLVK